MYSHKYNIQTTHTIIPLLLSCGLWLCPRNMWVSWCVCLCVCCKQENRGESKRNDFTALLIEITLTPPGERLRQRVFAKEEKSLRWTKGLRCYITAVHHVQKRVISAETPRSSASTMEWNKASRTSIEETFLVWMLMIPGIKHYFLYWYFK